jgi:hypothetical protein
MATEKQILANQQNAKHSTGPRAVSGKRRSRRNAIRHGLTTETVIDALEDAGDGLISQIALLVHRILQRSLPTPEL